MAASLLLSLGLVMEIKFGHKCLGIFIILLLLICQGEQKTAISADIRQGSTVIRLIGLSWIEI